MTHIGEIGRVAGAIFEVRPCWCATFRQGFQRVHSVACSVTVRVLAIEDGAGDRVCRALRRRVRDGGRARRLLIEHLQTKIAEDPDTHGSMLVGTVLGADKTTVSVMTGNQEYHPLYFSLSNFHNEVRRGHRDAVVPLAFLPIPKSKPYIVSPRFCPLHVCP